MMVVVAPPDGHVCSTSSSNVSEKERKRVRGGEEQPWKNQEGEPGGSNRV